MAESSLRRFLDSLPFNAGTAIEILSPAYTWAMLYNRDPREYTAAMRAEARREAQRNAELQHCPLEQRHMRRQAPR